MDYSHGAQGPFRRGRSPAGSLAAGLFLTALTLLAFGLWGCESSLVCMKKGWGYEVVVEAERASYNDIKRVEVMLLNMGFSVDWEERLEEIRYRGEVSTALYKEYGGGEHSFINALIYFVRENGGDAVNYPKFEIGNTYRGAHNEKIRAEIDGLGDRVFEELGKSPTVEGLKVERATMDPPACL